MESAGKSLSVIVPTAIASASVASAVGLLSVTVNVSSGSSIESDMVSTWMVLFRSPGENVSVLDFVVGSIRES